MQVMQESKKDPKLFVTMKKSAETLNMNINISEMQRESLREKWSKVAGRLDLILMIIFLIANVIICVTVIGMGYSKLNN
jgi:hypothetical protein